MTDAVFRNSFVLYEWKKVTFAEPVYQKYIKSETVEILEKRGRERIALNILQLQIAEKMGVENVLAGPAASGVTV